MNADAAVVVDANVAVKWFIPEPLSREARGLLDSVPLLGPDILAAEFGNVMLKKVARGEVEDEAAGRAVRRVTEIVELVSSDAVLEQAWQISRRYGRTFYDAIYVALAVSRGHILITGDEHLINALGAGFSDSVVWLGDYTAV